MGHTDKIDLTAILKAQKKFEEFRKDLTTEKDKAATVQAFEFCYELSWKLIKRVLESRGLEVSSPRDAFRQAVRNHLIDDPGLWFDFQRKRNLTVHTYDTKNLDLIISIVGRFSEEMDKLIVRVRDSQ